MLCRAYCTSARSLCLCLRQVLIWFHVALGVVSNALRMKSAAGPVNVATVRLLISASSPFCNLHISMSLSQSRNLWCPSPSNQRTPTWFPCINHLIHDPHYIHISLSHRLWNNRRLWRWWRVALVNLIWLCYAWQLALWRIIEISSHLQFLWSFSFVIRRLFYVYINIWKVYC